jgi:ATP-dependent helicase/nuclease subunit A
MPAKPRFATPPDQAERERILRELDSNLLVEAAAGTGKTTSMVGRMVELIAGGRCAVGTMAAITFTRKAAAELRSRFQVAMEAAHRGAAGGRRERLAAALAGSEGLYIGTIHSFCARLLRERPVEAGVDVAFREIDDAEDDLLREEAWADFCARLVAEDQAGRLGKLERLGLELRSLKNAFMRFADYPDVEEWPAAAASAGAPDFSSARRELTGYFEHMRKLGPGLPAETGNDSLLPRYRDLPRLAAHYDDLGDPVQLAELLSRFGPAKIVQKEWTKTGVFTRDEAKGELARWEAFVAETAAPALAAWRAHRYGTVVELLRAAAERYGALRAERGVLNYQDLLMKAAALLRGAPHVRRYFRRRLTHLLVDEFQDTDPVQAEVMLLLTADDESETDWRKCRPRPGSLFVVGDPKQSIYRFRRADIATYNEVKRIVGRESPVVTLSASFRTSPVLVEWINAVFGSADGFPPEATDDSPACVPLQPARQDPDAPGRCGLNVLTVPEEESGSRPAAAAYEADVIARFVREAVAHGRPPGDFMIVTRNTTWLGVYARALQACGVPHQVTGGAALNGLREVALLHGALAAALRPDDPVRLVACLRGELFGTSDRDLYAFKKAGGRFDFSCPVPAELPAQTKKLFDEAFAKLGRIRRWLDDLPPAVAVERATAELGLMASAGLSAGADVQAGALAKAIELLRGRGAESWSATAVVEYLGELVASREAQKHDALSARPEEKPVVRVMNLHQAKGLEAPAVFLADPGGEREPAPDLHIDRSGTKTRGYMAVLGERPGEFAPEPLLAHPAGWEKLSDAEARFATAENLRLRYVAATRAGSMLTVVKRTRRERENPWQFFAPYLKEAAELEAPAGAAGPAKPAEKLVAAEVQRALDAAGAGLDELARHTCEVHRAKEFALAGHRPSHLAPGWFPPEEEAELGRDEAAEHAPDTTEAGRGARWGIVIHQLLEAAAGNPGVDLAQLARERLAGQELPADLAGKAEAEARGVMRSELWRRAMASPRRLAEPPFELLDDAAGSTAPVVLRGAIDLIFEEPGGWVLVDYKTDEVAEAHLAERARSYAPQLDLYARAWERCTGLKIKERWVYFTKPQKAVKRGPAAEKPRREDREQGRLFD